MFSTLFDAFSSKECQEKTIKFYDENNEVNKDFFLNYIWNKTILFLWTGAIVSIAWRLVA